jgi:hypothetical protein
MENMRRISKIILFAIIFFAILSFQKYAESLADNHDLSGVKVPVDKVSTGDKVIDILDKIEKADSNVYFDKITTIEPKKVDGQYCFVKVIIKQSENTIVKEEVLECSDGRKTATGPSYWELFAQFYYRDVSTPEYCRFYSRPNHVFKSFGKTCLKVNGEWEVK